MMVNTEAAQTLSEIFWLLFLKPRGSISKSTTIPKMQLERDVFIKSFLRVMQVLGLSPHLYIFLTRLLQKTIYNCFLVNSNLLNFFLTCSSFVELPNRNLINEKQTIRFLSQPFPYFYCPETNTPARTQGPEHTHVHSHTSMNDLRQLRAGDEQDKQAICLSAFRCV